VGINGIGKSTALQILGNKLKPNLGRYSDPPEWKEILKYFKGSELQKYLTRMLEEDLKPVIKPQYVDMIRKKVQGNVGEYIGKRDVVKKSEVLKYDLELEKLYERNIEDLSGGELQRLALMIAMIQETEVYMFDEPTSYLDVKQRIKMAKLVRRLQTLTNYIIVVEHDLSILDYLSDYICCLYGEQSAYGVVTMPHTVREGINIFLSGFEPTENMRFREEELHFRISDTFMEINQDKVGWSSYPEMVKKQGNFTLTVRTGKFKSSQITVMLGENGTGKTTFIKMLAEAGKKKNE
jgi:ATP-binding cassette subfamily E protein 1